MTPFQPRPAQARVLSYTGGRLAVSAAPGSGKTETLAHLAANLVVDRIGEDEEVLIVTLVNSAVENLKRRINQAIRARGERMLPGFGYRVRTLHGLAHDIVRERPGLVGLPEDFSIVDEFESSSILNDAVDAWLRAHPDSAHRYLKTGLTDSQVQAVRRRDWPSLVRDLAATFVRRAKDLQMTPELLAARLAQAQGTSAGASGEPGWWLAQMGTEIYTDYQRSLTYRGAVDFDDLVRLALAALQRDAGYLERLQDRWTYILEDEAQDSSQIQEGILRLLSAKHGNWVRVGDTNQAIFETFTTASPKLLRGFLQETGVVTVEFTQSGRSQQAIMDLANYLVDWTLHQHPNSSMRGARPGAAKRKGSAPFLWLAVTGTDAGDPQENPPVDWSVVRLVDRPYTPQQELEFVVGSLRRWHRRESRKDEQDRQTCAALVPRTEHGLRLADLLKRQSVPFVELLRTTSSTRETVGLLHDILACLAEPGSARKLSTAFEAWAGVAAGSGDSREEAARVARRISACTAVESYLWPRADQDWLAELQLGLSPEENSLLEEFREAARRWHRAAELPVDQLILSVASELLREPTELALAHKLALLLRDVSDAYPAFRLPEFVEELREILENRRRFTGFANEDTGFEPPKGVVTITTMHKAKGLEWDRVYLLSVNSFDFPSGSGDVYQDERWFVRDSLNLMAESSGQLEALAELGAGPSNGRPNLPREGEASQRARRDYVAERLRLLYVGITRARRELMITWNTGRRSEYQLQPAEALKALWTQFPLAREQGGS